MLTTFFTKEYRTRFKTLKESCDKHSIEIIGEELESTGDWTKNCSKKASFVYEKLRNNEYIAWIDSDKELTERIDLEDYLISGFDMITNVKKPDEIKQGFRSQIYRYHLERYGFKFVTDFLIFKKNKQTLQLCKKWAELCDKYPSVWDEQLLLIAYQMTGMRVKFADIKDEDKKAIRHNPVSRVMFSKNNERRQCLVVGSANYVPRWLEKNLGKYIESGFAIVALNNAWAMIDEELIHYWLKPFDYISRITDSSGNILYPSKNIPTNEVIESRVGKKEWITRPYFDMSIQTTFNHAMYHLLNEAIQDGCKLEVHVIGCDMDYSGANTHFYGNGTPDPLRFNHADLANSLNKIKNVFSRTGNLIYNVSDNNKTRLPFPKLGEKEALSVMYETKTKAEIDRGGMYVANRRIYSDIYGNLCEESSPMKHRLFLAKGQALQGGIRRAFQLGLVKLSSDEKEIARRKRGRPSKKYAN